MSNAREAHARDELRVLFENVLVLREYAISTEVSSMLSTTTDLDYDVVKGLRIRHVEYPLL